LEHWVEIGAKKTLLKYQFNTCSFLASSSSAGLLVELALAATTNKGYLMKWRGMNNLCAALRFFLEKYIRMPDAAGIVCRV
jgi:hypothetical protein